MKVGNYWIYQLSQDDSLGNYTMLNSFDSLYIEKDTVMFGAAYYKFINVSFNNFFLFAPYVISNYLWIKDSAGCIISHPYRKLLDVYHLADTIQRTVDPGNTWAYTATVPDTFVNHSFEMGIYSGYWTKYYTITDQSHTFWQGMHMFQAYVRNIGIIKSRYTYSGCPKMCRYSQHLVRCKLN